MATTLARMRQLIGTTANWAANDLVIGDGELALERTVAGVVLTKLGDGVKRYSQLGYVDFDVPVAPVPVNPFPAPTFQKFLSGSGTYRKNFAFVISPGSAAAGDTYTNNGITFTVYATVSNASLIYLAGNGDPTASGVLTRTAGAGSATLTYTLAIAPKFLKVRMIGGGGGGGGSGVTNPAGSVGASTVFGTSTATGGSNGAVNAASTIGAGMVGYNAAGGRGGGGSNSGSATTFIVGGHGGSGAFGGAGHSSIAGAVAGLPNTGGGGAGAGAGNAAGLAGGVGGNSGDYLDLLISAPASTYAYTVGAGGNGGPAGSSGFAGGAGGSGVILVEECYQ